MLTAAIAAIVSAVISAAVSVFLGPLRIRLEEAARRDIEVRKAIRSDLSGIILQLRREVQRRCGGVGASQDAFTYGQLYTMLRPIARALENPDLKPKIREELKKRLSDLVGGWRIEYLALASEKYVTAAESGHKDPALFGNVFAQTQQSPQSTTPIDDMLDGQQNDIASVKRVLAGFQECLQIVRAN